MRLLAWADRWMERVCGWGTVLCALLMIFWSLLGIVLRWCEWSPLWIDPLVRHLVLLAAFLGGVLAIGRGGHISIDLFSRHLQGTGQWRWYRLHKKLISLACAGGVGWLALASGPFISSEWQYGRPDFLGIHSGYLVSLVPFGLALLAVRFLLQFLLPVEVPGGGSDG